MYDKSLSLYTLWLDTNVYKSGKANNRHVAKWTTSGEDRSRRCLLQPDIVVKYMRGADVSSKSASEFMHKSRHAEVPFGDARYECLQPSSIICRQLSISLALMVLDLFMWLSAFCT